jgi:hypothetical protein
MVLANIHAVGVCSIGLWVECTEAVFLSVAVYSVLDNLLSFNPRIFLLDGLLWTHLTHTFHHELGNGVDLGFEGKTCLLLVLELFNTLLNLALILFGKSRVPFIDHHSVVH